MEFIYSSTATPERDISVRADAAGQYVGTVPLSEGINVIEIIGYHGTSSGQARQFVLIEYAGRYPPLDLTVHDPPDGFTTTERILTINGFTGPDAELVINDLVPALPDPNGHWAANLLLQPGENVIHIVATRGDEALEASITVIFQPGS